MEDKPMFIRFDRIKERDTKNQREICMTFCNFVDLCSVWPTTTQTSVNDVTAVIFSNRCFYPTKIPSYVRKHIKKDLLHAFHPLTVFNQKICDHFTLLLAKST